MCGVVWCYTGPPAEADEVFAPVREQLRPAARLASARCRTRRCRALFDALLPDRPAVVLEGGLRRTSSPTRRSTRTSSTAAQLPTMQSTMHLYPIDGAVQPRRRGRHGLGYRDANWAQVIVGVDPGPGQRRAIDALGARLLGGAAPATRRAAPT